MRNFPVGSCTVAKYIYFRMVGYLSFLDVSKTYTYAVLEVYAVGMTFG